MFSPGSSQWGKGDKIGNRLGPAYKKGAEKGKDSQIPEPFKEAREKIPGRFQGRQITSGPHVNPHNMRFKVGRGPMAPDQVESVLAEVKKKGGLKQGFKPAEVKENGPVSNTGLADGMFDAPTYWPEPYQPGISFLKEQPMSKRKIGFGNGDAMKRSEFSSSIRTAQYRKQLEAEGKMADKVADVAMTKLGITRADLSITASTEPLSSTAKLGASTLSPSKTRSFAKKTQFDRNRDIRDDVYERTTIHSPKKNIDLGSMSTSSRAIGAAAAGIEPTAPAYPRRSVTKEFFRGNGNN